MSRDGTLAFAGGIVGSGLAPADDLHVRRWPRGSRVGDPYGSCELSLAVILVAMYAVSLIVNVAQGLHRDYKDLLRHLPLEFLCWKYT